MMVSQLDPVRDLRVGIVVVAYNAADTLQATLDRIPDGLRQGIAEIFICDDASNDQTFELAVDWAQRTEPRPRTTVIRRTKNLGYGGNQKAAYAEAIDHGLDVVVMLHGDGQYAPECMPDLIAPFADPSVDAVFGSRMMDKGAARRGGMPLYKRVGNRILTAFENRVLGTELSEFHSGYRAYRTSLLRRIPFERNTDEFDFDTQIIAQIVQVGGRIVEVPIPTYYGDEICYVNGLGYATDVVKDVLEFRLGTMGFGSAEWVQTPEEYSFKEGDGSSHAVMLEMLDGEEPCRILDVGCSGGLLAAKLRERGHHVVGVDIAEVGNVRKNTDDFYVGNLEHGLPDEVGDDFDVVIAGDVIEHLSRPTVALRELSRVVRPGGQMIISVPNFGHWYPRLRVVTGSFGYDRRGILDDTHLRFFTRRLIRRTVTRAGLDILEERTTGLPLGEGLLSRVVKGIDRMLRRLRPTMFAYQNVLRLQPHAEESIAVAHPPRPGLPAGR
jgi:SAM-dependent methyltransferase